MQDYLKEVKPVLGDDISFSEMLKIERRYIQNDWVRPLEVADLIDAYLVDARDGVIDEKGNVIGDLKKSRVMAVCHKGEANLPSKALSNGVNMRQNSGAEM